MEKLYAGQDEQEDPSDLVRGITLNVEKVEVLRKQTKPPSRYSENTLLGAMESTGRFVDDEELEGTSERKRTWYSGHQSSDY